MPIIPKKQKEEETPTEAKFDIDSYIRALEPHAKWRYDQCLRMGFGEAISLILSTAPEFDWHKAQRMLDLGFDHRTTAREFL